MSQQQQQQPPPQGSTSQALSESAMLARLAAQATQRDRQNWYIHMCFIRKDFAECLVAIEEQLRASRGQSEFALYVKALILRQEGRIDESLTAFQAALGLSPQSLHHIKQVGRSFFLLGRHRAALEVFAEAERLCQDDRDVFFCKGMCYFYMGDFHKAIENLEIANSIQRTENTYVQLARAHRSLGQEDDALRCYMDALEAAPESSELLTAIGLLFLKAGKSAKAFEHLGNALTYDPRNAKTILAAGSIIQDNQDNDVALVKYRVAACQTPNSPHLWNNIGMCFFGKGKFVAAVACLKRALYFSPFEWTVHYNLGVVHLTTEQHASAFHHFSAAINLNASHAKAYMYLAVSLARLDDFENACAAYEKAIELGAGWAAHLNYAATLLRNDEEERAREQLGKYEQLFGAVADAHDHDAESASCAAALRRELY